MRSLLENKRLILVVSILALGALTVLAIGLNNVPFRAARSFSREEAGDPKFVLPVAIDSDFDSPAWMQISVFALVLFMVVLIGALLSPELRKRLFLIMIRVGITYWALYIVFTRYRELLTQMSLDLLGADRAPGSASSGEPVPEFIPPQSVSLTSYLISFGIAVLLIIVARRVYAFWKEMNAADAEPSFKKVAGIARSSLRDLSSGRDSTDVIINCYFRMSDVVADKRNLNRGAAMTPNEFAGRLEQAGLPGDAVRRLTRLFEKVRYGGHRSDSTSVNEAVACLTTILHYCGETV
jgi:hypothetical protein